MDLNVPSPWGLTPSQAARVQDVIATLVYLTPTRVTAGKLNKLLYIAELKHIKQFGKRLCPARLMHWKHGPYSFDVEEALDILDGDVLQIEHIEGARGAIRLIQPAKMSTGVRLKEKTIAFLKEIGDTWGRKDYSSELVPFAYATMPFAETPFHQVIDLDKYVSLPEKERNEVDYAPDEETQRAIDAALKVPTEALDTILDLVDA